MVSVLLDISDINECLSSPCSYGSTCIDGIGEYKCLCPPERTGTRCQKVKGQIPAPQSCLYKRRTYHHSFIWEDDCKKCECDDGTINCEEVTVLDYIMCYCFVFFSCCFMC